jgi:hypothetical protein
MSHLILRFKKNNQIPVLETEAVRELISLVSDSYTAEEYEKSRFDTLKLYGNGPNDWGELNKTITPKEWFSLYRYSKEYGNFTTITNSYNFNVRQGNVLDFGAGSGLPWVDIPSEVTLYLLEANLVLAERLKNTYSEYTNVKVVTLLEEIADIRFDYVYSKDVLEHVRYINEHLNILYHLGNLECQYDLMIDTAPSGGHVLNLYGDTTIDSFWTSLS